VDPAILTSRLEHLEAMGLAERQSSNVWSFSENWQKQLRELGTREDIIKQIDDAVRGDASRYRIVRAGEPLMTDAEAKRKALVGRVAAKGLADEMKSAFYAVLEAPNGFAYHVPLDVRTAEAVRPGDLVLFGSRREPTVRSIDRQIAASAVAAGGTYVLDGPSHGPERARAANRLRELEREGLVSVEGPGRWTVPADFIEKLEARGRMGLDRERLWIQKLPPLDATSGHPGPVWLDHVERDTLAPWGFGADVGRALDKRRDALRSLGVAPDDPRRDAKLRELARRAVGEGMAARTGQQFLAKAPEHFRGRMLTAPDGAPYAVVTDGARFVVVPASRDLRDLAGKPVAISRDAQGRLRVRALDRDRDR
jgi:hypothetical protein